MVDLISAIDRTIETLELCQDTEAWVSKYRRCRETIQVDPNNAVAREEIAVLSSPRGFLGDYPLMLKAGSCLSIGDLRKRRWDLVEDTQNALKNAQP